MFYGENRQSLRNQYFSAWEKYNKNLTLTPLEKQIVQIIKAHPEYIKIIENKELYEDKDYLPENGQTNPFLHLSLHLAIRDQIKTNRPEGINEFYKKQLNKKKYPAQIEHQMMEVLAEIIWQSQKSNKIPDESEYLRLLELYLK